MEEKIVFKDKKSGEVYRAEWLQDDGPQDPRRDWDNLGTMVFADFRHYSLGDKQVSDFREFFIGQLNESGEEAKEYVEGTITIPLPTLEDCAAHPDELSRFVAGTKESGYHFDKDLFSQEMDGLLDGLGRGAPTTTTFRRKTSRNCAASTRKAKGFSKTPFERTTFLRAWRPTPRKSPSP